MNFILLCGLPLNRFKLTKSSGAKYPLLPVHASECAHKTFSTTQFGVVSVFTLFVQGDYGGRIWSPTSLSIPNRMQDAAPTPKFLILPRWLWRTYGPNRNYPKWLRMKK